MPFARVWKLGQLLALVGALGITFLVSFFVSMRVALRAREVSVPSLTGVTVNDATVTLGDMGLTLQVDANGRPDARIPAGRIMQQDPPFGTRARTPRPVRVWVSTGPRLKSIPRMVGEPERTARIRLDQSDIEIAALTEVRSTGYPPDTIIAQSPEPNEAGTRIKLLISRGEPPLAYVMPDVSGANGEHAADDLRQQGLRVAIVATLAVPDVMPGTVLHQEPAAGARVTITDIVSLEVSR
jgi:eukaryotic-like serine/threonine-protein kinase